MPLLWVRDLASGEAQPLAGTEDASPALLVAGLERPGVLQRRVVEARVGGWRAGAHRGRLHGHVSAVPEARGPLTGRSCFSGQFDLFRVPADGGAARVVMKPPTQDWSYYWPTFLPDGRRFLFTAKLWTRNAESSDQGIYIGSVDNPKIERLLPDLSSAVYAPPGYLVFVRDGTLTAVPFDLTAARVTGPPVAIGGAVATEPCSTSRQFRRRPTVRWRSATTGRRIDQHRDERRADGTAPG